MQIWDIGGAGSMQGSMLDKYAFGAHAIMLVYDVTNGSSFDQLSGINHMSIIHLVIILYCYIKKTPLPLYEFTYFLEWLKAVKNVSTNAQGEISNTQGAAAGPSSASTNSIRPRYALVANKIDQEHLRVIKSERHHKFAQVDI